MPESSAQPTLSSCSQCGSVDCISDTGSDGVERVLCAACGHERRPICPRCDLTIERGEELHPTVTPSHVRCNDHNGQCYVLCINAHPEYIAWYQGKFGRTPTQRIKPGLNPLNDGVAPGVRLFAYGPKVEIKKPSLLRALWEGYSKYRRTKKTLQHLQ